MKPEPVQPFPHLSPADLIHRLGAGRPLFLVDVLPREHFAAVHLPNAGNACIFEVTFLDQVRAITDDPAAEIVLYGAGAATLDALTAAEKLDRAGYRNLAILLGGLEAWCGAGQSLAGEEGAASGDPGTMLALADGRYRIDPQRSTVEWAGRNVNSRHHGFVGISRGEIAVSDGTITGSCELDMTSIRNVDLDGSEWQPVLHAHLNSDDFFFTSLFPRARFSILGSSMVAEPFVTVPNYQLHGILELRGVKAEQSFWATVARTADGTLVAEAHFDLDRTRWNVNYGSARFFEHLGRHAVFEPISIQLRIVAA